METVLKVGGKVVDRYKTPFGLRQIKFDANKGFFLNGKNIKLKGFCLHQDAGSLGTAVPDASYLRRLQIIKEYGCNAIRCSHNPPSPEFLDMCDSLGFVVIDEAFDKWKSGYYTKYFDDWWQKDLDAMLLRDRNHPSVILWSIGNETREQDDDSGKGTERAIMLRDHVRKTEPTRMITAAIRPTKERVYNKNDFVFGQFLWAGADYLGESSGWPSTGWATGLFDNCMFEKPLAAFHRSVWNDEPMVRIAVADQSLDIDPGKPHWSWPFLAEHWNFPQYQGHVIEVHTTTNCETAELWLNNQSLGRRNTADYSNNTIVWYVPYKPGKIEAKGYNGNKEAAAFELETTGKPAKIGLSADRKQIEADGQDLSHVTIHLVDDKGRIVPDTDQIITVDVPGNGKLLGMDNGDLRRNGSYTGNKIKTYRGKALAIIQSDRSRGEIKIKVSSPGLPDAFVTILCE